MTSSAALAPELPETRPSRLRALPTPSGLSVAAADRSGAREADAVIARPRLLEQLGDATRVVVVSAPPGSGKTSLLRSWIRETGLGTTAAWLPMERAKRDPQHFWLSIVQALRHTEAGFARLHEVTAAPDFDGWAFVTDLLTDLAPLDRRLWLIIDDLDELDDPDTLRQLELLLADAPAELRFALSTRRDLPLGLHRMRLDGGLTELRGPDLRFDLAEARAMFETAGVDLPDCALAVLVERTEGWAAGLRLAALSLARHPDPERFVSEFSGSERTVAGYLRAEVLERQPADVRELLLRTSILERVSGPLADHVAGCSGSERDLSGAGRRQRVRDLARRRTIVVSLPPPVRATCSSSSCGGLSRRSSDRCTGPRPDGSSRRDARSKRSGTRKPRATGRTPRTCCWTAASA